MLTLFQVGLMIAANNRLYTAFWNNPCPFIRTNRRYNVSNNQLQWAVLDGKWLDDITLKWDE